MTEASEAAVAVVRSFWEALYARDWERIASFFGPESIYYDVPVGPTGAGKGPDGIVKRLKLGLEPLSGYEHSQGPIVGDDSGVVMTEHAETWHWSTGESVTLPFVSVQRVEGGIITRWRDYWDYQTLIGAAPPWWNDRLAEADLSWVYDATGDAP